MFRVAESPRQDHLRTRARRRVVLGGALLLCAAGLPLTPDGDSPARWCLDAATAGAFQGLWSLSSMGLPFLFGGVAALTSWLPPLRDHPGSVRTLRAMLLVLHGHLLLFAVSVLGEAGFIATIPLVGFAAISMIAFGWHAERLRTDRHETSEHHRLQLTRWGAAILAPIAAWARLQTLGDLPLGPCVDVTIASSLALVFATRAHPAERP